MRIRLRGSAALLSMLTALAVLAGCAVPQPTPQQGSASISAATASSGADYRGRFSVRYDDANGTPRNAYGNFEWQDQGDAITLTLNNPLGQTMAVIASTPDGATLTLPNRAPQSAPGAEELMRRVIGFDLPVGDLRYWLRATASPRSPAQRTDDPATGRPTRISQDGWTIDYVAFAAPPSTAIRRIDVTRDSGVPPVAARLVIDP